MKENRIDKRYWLIVLGVFFVLFIMTFLVLSYSPLNPFRGDDSYTDSSVFKYIAYAMTRGEMPYRDSFDHKGPLIYFINLLGMKISFWRGVWLIEYVFMLASFFFLYRVARLFTGRGPAILAIICGCAKIFDYYEGGNFTEEYSLLFIAASLYFFLDYFLNEKISRLRLILCGICFACVCMLRVNMIAVWIVFCIAVAVKCICEKKLGEMWKFIAYFLIGCLIVFAPIIIWLVSNGIFGDFYDAYIGFNIMYSADESRASFINKVLAFIYIMGNPINLFASTFLLIATAKKWIDRYAGVSCFAALLLSTWMVALSGMQYNHYGMVVIPFVLAVFAIMLKKLYECADAVTAGIIISLVLSLLCISPWIDSACFAIDNIENRTEMQFEEHTFLVENFIKDNTEEDDRITVYGNWDILYVISGRLSASRYSYQSPIKYVDDRIIKEYFADLEENRPKLVIIPKNGMDEDMQKYLDDNGFELMWSQTGDTMAGTLIYK